MSSRPFSQIEVEVLGSPDPESGEVNAASVEQLLLWPKAEVLDTLQRFSAEGLAEPAEGDTYRLTQQGQAAYAAWDEKQHQIEKRRIIEERPPWGRS